MAVQFDSLFDPIGVGIRRASVFAAFGVRAARHPDIQDHSFPNLIFNHSFVGQPTSDEVQEYKKEFERWILACSFREALESMELTLQRLYEICLRTTIKTEQELDSEIKKFRLSSLPQKLAALSQWGISTPKADLVLSFQKLRNCLSHRMGLVIKEDCSEEGALVVTVFHMQPIVAHTDGTRTSIPLGAAPGFEVVKEGSLGIQFVETRLRFPVNSQVRLKETEVVGSLQTLYFAALELKQSAFETFSRLGLVVNKA
jgi:hypothetical protein